MSHMLRLSLGTLDIRLISGVFTLIRYLNLQRKSLSNSESKEFED